jgi:site-specific DNA-methyltransferase (adenine-specific)
MAWLDENLNSIMLGDCLSLIKNVPDKSIDLIIADPPYKIDNTEAGGDSDFSKSFQKMNDELVENELNINLGIDFCKEVPRIQEKINIYIWCNKAQVKQYLDYFLDELNCNYEIIQWRKTNAPPTFNNKYLTDKEYCLYFRKGGYCCPQNYNDAKTIWDLPINIKDKNKYGHPTIKPTPIIEAFIRNSSKEGQ